MNNLLGVSPSKGKQGTTRGKEKIFCLLKHEISLIIAYCVIMAFCSFGSLVGGTYGSSPENPNVVHFVDSKNSDRDVTEHT